MKLPKFFKTKWRVVTDNLLGYTIQKKFWWFPVWFRVDKYNGYVFSIGGTSFYSAENALEKIKEFTTPVPKFKPEVVATYEP